MEERTPYRDKPVTIPITFQEDEVPESVRKLEPDVYTDASDSYCCSKGDPVRGIAGCGPSPIEAMRAFDQDYQRKRKEGTLPDGF